MKLSRTERAALQHAREWIEYSRSAQSKIDAEADRLRRMKADIAAGHSPDCTLTKCASNCQRVSK